MNIVDKLYELIKSDSSINTFNTYSDLFQDFYYHNMSIRYNGSKVIKIYEYILSLNISEEHETMPYINSKIFNDFNNYEMFITQSAYDTTLVKDDNYIELLFNLIDTYDAFNKYNDQGVLHSLIDYNTFVRDYTGSMIVLLNSSFFNMSNDNIFKLMDMIKNNSYLKSIIEEKSLRKGLLDKDYIIEYLNRFLFNLEFVNTESIKDDILINAIKEAKIKSKELLEKIFKTTDIIFLFEAFDNGLLSLVDILEKSFDNELDRITLFKIIYNKLLKKRYYRTVLDFIINDHRYNKYINEQEENNIIEGFCNNYPLNITDKEIKFILKRKKNHLFLLNLKADCNDNNWSEETKKLVNEITKDIENYNFDFNDAINVLNSLFTGERKPSLFEILGCLKSLIKNTLCNNEDTKVYIILNDDINGCAFRDNNCIKLNYKLIKKIMETNDHESNPKSLYILETLFHEIRHLQQFIFIDPETDDEKMYNYYKEDILVSICTQYYEENYIGVSYERDARIMGAQKTVTLLSKYFPFMKKSIRYFSKKVVFEAGRKEKMKKVFELSENISVDEALEKLISVNPSLIQKYKLLEREYNLDGTKKTKVKN